MGKFLTGTALDSKLTDIIWNAKKRLIILSPFIKLDTHVKEIFKKIKVKHTVELILVFGKNEGYKQKSFNVIDFEYFKEFQNIAILYNKDLHAKHYSNEKEALVTSLNLYDYSMANNIEYGISFSDNLFHPTDKLYEETEEFTYKLIFEQSELVFLKKPLYTKKLFGLAKSYEKSTIHFDVSDEFFKGRKYEVKRLQEFNIEALSDTEKMFEEKPQRQEKITKKKIEKPENTQETGYCIRTGEQIAYNPERPYSYYSFRTWNEFKNYDYPEYYCHKTGKESKGETSMRNPILFT